MSLIHKENYRDYRIHVYERKHKTRSTGRRFTNLKVVYGQQYLDMALVNFYTDLTVAVNDAKRAIDIEYLGY